MSIDERENNNQQDIHMIPFLLITDGDALVLTQLTFMTPQSQMNQIDVP